MASKSSSNPIPIVYDDSKTPKDWESVLLKILDQRKEKKYEAPVDSFGATSTYDETLPEKVNKKK